MKWFVCVLSLFFAFFLSSSVSAQLLFTTESPKEASGMPSPEPNPILTLPENPSGSLLGASIELEAIASALEELFLQAKKPLEEAGISLDASEQSLVSSIKSVGTSIEFIEASRMSLKEAADLTKKELRRRGLEVGLWRAGAMIAIGGALGALARGRTDDAGLGAGVGAAIGVLWFIWDRWPLF